MDALSPPIILLITILLLSSFVKVATVLSICRYGLGLIGFEFGAVCLVVSAGLAIFLCPPELTAIGFPDALLSRSQNIQPQMVSDALIPFMQRRLDPAIAKYLNRPSAGSSQNSSEKTAEKTGEKNQEQLPKDVRTLVPVYVLSELKVAFQIGCLLLIPLVLIDLATAHIVSLVGIQNISVSVISLPLKLLAFIAAGGWGLLGKKILGLE